MPAGAPTLRDAFRAARESCGVHGNQADKNNWGTQAAPAPPNTKKTAHVAIPVSIPVVVVSVLGVFGALYVGLDMVDHLPDGSVRLVDSAYRGYRAIVALGLTAAYVTMLQLLSQHGYPRISWGISLTFPALWLLLVLIIFPLGLFNPTANSKNA
jgi:hypothetical protein